MTTNLSSPPVNDSITEIEPTHPVFKFPHYFSKKWQIWLGETVFSRMQSTSQVILTKTLTAQAASIASTPFTIGTIAAGLYRLSWAMRITTAATVSSSLAIGFSWTETAVSLTHTDAAITGNTTTTIQSGMVMIRSDANAPIQYIFTYASVGATPMQFRADLLVERLV